MQTYIVFFVRYCDYRVIRQELYTFRDRVHPRQRKTQCISVNVMCVASLLYRNDMRRK